MKIEVAKNTKRNIIVGVLNKTVLVILPFVVRSVIVNVLGSQYLGLNSLFTSILSVLALSEMGFGVAMVYHMYKPIAEDDQETINALLNLYKKVYRIIGVCILVIGAVLIPFLPNLINGGHPEDVNLAVVYSVELVNTALTYFLFGYKQSLLIAYQRDDVKSLINLVTQIGLQGSQIRQVADQSGHADRLAGLADPVSVSDAQLLYVCAVHAGLYDREQSVDRLYDEKNVSRGAL